MAIRKSPLPTLHSPRIQELRLSEWPNRHSVYSMILRAEQYAVQQQADESIVSARVLGYLLLEFHAQSGIFGDAPCAALVGWVMSLPRSAGDNEHDVIFGFGRLCRDKFIRLFRTFNVQAPRPSTPPSRPFVTVEDMIKDSMKPSGKGYRASRKKALARDGYRCMVTGRLDDNSFYNCADLQAVAEFVSSLRTDVKTAHILNESTIRGTDPAGISQIVSLNNMRYAETGATAVLKQFGFSKFAEAFKQPEDFHQVWNLLSLEHNLHFQFGRWSLWFESIDQPGRYKVCLLYGGNERYIRSVFERPEPHIAGAPMIVEFTSRFEEAPPPDPDLLMLHATCARVAHMSGAAEFFNRLEWEAGDIDVLASDGSSASLLSYLLSPFAAIHEAW